MDLLRGPIAERRVETLGIVAELNVACHVFAGVFARRVGGAVDAFDFQRGVEGLGQGVIETRPGPTDRPADIEFGGGRGERPAGVLRAAVGVKPNSV